MPNITQEILAERVRIARLAADLTQDELAQALGLPRTAIVQLESGNRAISTLELARIAEQCARSISSFFEEETEESDALVTILRATDELENKDEWKAELAKYVTIFREGVSLQKYLDAPLSSGPPEYKQPSPSRVMEAVDQGSKVAQQERLRLNLGMNPIPDMADLINSQGIWASGAKLLDAVSGLFMRHSSIGLGILVNFTHPRARKRFSYAHEYAHALMDRSLRASVSVTAKRSDLHEVRANAFAADFLMPSGGVNAFLESRGKSGPNVESQTVYDAGIDEGTDSNVRGQRRALARAKMVTFEDLVALARHFGVSYIAAAYRLKSLSIVNELEFENLKSKESIAEELTKILDGFGNEGPEKNSKPDREIVSQVLHLAMEAFRREKISEGKLRDIAKLLDFPGRTLIHMAKSI